MKSNLGTATMLAFALVTVSGCAALKSTRHTDSKIRAGVGYYLPNGDIRVTLKLEANKDPVFAIDTLYYPDVSHRYSVSVPKNIAGDTEMTVKVNSSGLLQSVDYKYEPKIIEAVRAISPEANAGPNPKALREDKKETCEQRQYVLIFRVNAEGTYERSQTICGFLVTVNPSGTERQPSESYDDRRYPPKDGIYFRLNLPYAVTIHSLANKSHPIHQDIALSPTGASTLFVSTNRAAFSTMSGKIAFNNGVLTEFSPKNTSEIETGFKLPAAILKSYFDSVNALFVLRTGSADKEAEFLTAIQNLNAAKASLDACQAAYESKDDAKIASDCKKAKP